RGSSWTLLEGVRAAGGHQGVSRAHTWPGLWPRLPESERSRERSKDGGPAGCQMMDADRPAAASGPAWEAGTGCGAMMVVRPPGDREGSQASSGENGTIRARGLLGQGAARDPAETGRKAVGNGSSASGPYMGRDRRRTIDLMHASSVWEACGRLPSLGAK